MFWMEVSTYFLPERPMVTTRINEAVPITMPSAVRAKRIWFRRNESMASNTISRNAMLLVLRTLGNASSISQEYQGDPNGYQAKTGPTLRADALAQKEYRPARSGDVA